jgi:NAD(P)-dependent dehydrogenase (short-subunit alcohol dehydrogenase family)
LGLAKELGPEGVRVNAIRPGLVDTEIHATGGEPDRARILGATAPLGRPGTAEEIASAALWLISDAASYVTGALLGRLGRALTAAPGESARPESGAHGCGP